MLFKRYYLSLHLTYQEHHVNNFRNRTFRNAAGK